MNMKRLATIVACCLVAVTTALAFEPFRFAVVTDIHIAGGLPQSTEDLRQSVAQINNDSTIDFVLVTGDIADAGDGASLRIAKRELDKLVKPWYILEGNHDQNWSESGCMDFVKIFGYERFHFEHKGILFIGFHDAHGPRSCGTGRHSLREGGPGEKRQGRQSRVHGHPHAHATYRCRQLV